MESKDSKRTDPLQNLFADVKKILEFIEIKDIREAEKYETSESRNNAEMWMNAKLERDNYVTYSKFWNIAMFQEVKHNSRLVDIKKWMKHPLNVPIEYRDNLLKRGREIFLDSYEETNDYYRKLNGLPPINTPKSDFIYLTEPMRNQLHASDLPVHLLSPLIQNNYMGTDEYKKVVENNPEKEYLKYLGLYKIDTFIARNAKDFDIIRYSLNRSDINPNLINEFSSLYADYREYVMTTLYNSKFEDLFGNYRNFMKLLIMMFVLLQIPNRALESLNNRNYLDDSILHIILSMHDIPSSLLMTNEVRRNLVINMLKLVREKGTDNVYYDLIKILGYQDIIVSKLLLMKGQQFDENNNYKALDKVEPYFVQVDLNDKNPYDTIAKGNAPIHTYHDIVDGDPTWWDLPDTRAILENSDYSIADSKYIMVEAEIHQMKYLFESIYFTRMILDNKTYTDGFYVEIPEIFGTEPVSVYDLMVYIIAATCMNNNMSGEIFSDESELLATAGFNFDMDLDSFEDFLNTTKYVDKERVMDFMKNLTMRIPADVNRLYSEVIYPMREWLENKINNATNRFEYVEYESIYRALYTYDITRNQFLNDFMTPLETIKEKYNLGDDLLAYQHFYPRTISGEVVTVDTYNQSRYSYPFLERNDEIDWFIHVIIETPYGEDDRGYVYFHDILNHPDLRELTNPDGTRVFMDWNDGDIGWEINKQAVNKAISLIESLDENDLKSAHFQIDTPVLNSNGKVYKKGEKLPAVIRTGLYKNILIDKLMMDMQGLSQPPKTYLEYLYRKNTRLYNLLTDGNRFELDKDGWLNDVMTIVFALESELNIHMKYFEQSVGGSELYFKPLITLINHFKSRFVNFAKAGFKYVFGDKMDAGGNSNMFKLFDDVQFIVHFVTLANRGYESQFGLYDTEHSMIHKILMLDRSEMLKMIGNTFAVHQREERMGSIHIVDEAKFFKNGEPIDDQWISGEYDVGNNIKTHDMPVDLDGWKKYVQSYVPLQ